MMMGEDSWAEVVRTVAFLEMYTVEPVRWVEGIRGEGRGRERREEKEGKGWRMG